MKLKLFSLLFLVMAIQYKALPQDPAWVRDNTWFFDNFTQAELSWDVFRETFIGVAPAPSGDFDLMFYHALYKTELAKAGHCHGMDVMAVMMMKNGGHLGFCHPPYAYAGTISSPAVDTFGPTNPTLKRAIQIMHGYQISHGFLSHLLDVINEGGNRDGNYAFQQVNYFLAKNDPCVISVTKGISPADGGHVLIPFYTEDIGGVKKIFVYDPNRSYYNLTDSANGREFYDLKRNYIQVYPSGKWVYHMGGSSGFWKGDPGSDGNCIVIPISIAGRRDRLPQSLLADASYTLNTIFIFAKEATVEQITEPASGRRLFRPGSHDWETGEKQRMKNVLPFVPLGNNAPKPSGTQVYFVRGNRLLDIQLRVKGPYKIGMWFNGKHTEIKGTGDGGITHFLTPWAVKTAMYRLPKSSLIKGALK